ncbi:hypothetical protein Poly41_09040 [Novipirellula artificiosorum]|uniref:Uncharacterized protein n=1 Tax=Novipirellula artificiosorum TaxID=2528016 RepID=A0A5C6E5A1_9BACT|nr:hypothetical protein Poly41_09040 [Novipirellula artificiosorum]
MRTFNAERTHQVHHFSWSVYLPLQMLPFINSVEPAERRKRSYRRTAAAGSANGTSADGRRLRRQRVEIRIEAQLTHRRADGLTLLRQLDSSATVLPRHDALSPTNDPAKVLS